MLSNLDQYEFYYTMDEKFDVIFGLSDFNQWKKFKSKYLIEIQEEFEFYRINLIKQKKKTKFDDIELFLPVMTNRKRLSPLKAAEMFANLLKEYDNAVLRNRK